MAICRSVRGPNEFEVRICDYLELLNLLASKSGLNSKATIVVNNCQVSFILCSGSPEDFSFPNRKAILCCDTFATYHGNSEKLCLTMYWAKLHAPCS